MFVRSVELLNICDMVSNAVISFFEMLFSRMCDGCFNAFIRFCAEIIAVSVGVVSDIVPCVGKHCAVARIHFSPVLGTKKW